VYSKKIRLAKRAICTVKRVNSASPNFKQLLHCSSVHTTSDRYDLKGDGYALTEYYLVFLKDSMTICMHR